MPQNSPEEGTVELRVVYQEQSSLPVTMRAGFEKTSVSVSAPAYVGMPVWLEVDLPPQLHGAASYPGALGPAHFGCSEVQARRHRQNLPVLPGANWDRMGITFSGNICGSYSYERQQPNRLAIHLVYQFDVAGDYEVRFHFVSRTLGISDPDLT